MMLVSGRADETAALLPSDLSVVGSRPSGAMEGACSATLASSWIGSGLVRDEIVFRGLGVAGALDAAIHA